MERQLTIGILDLTNTWEILLDQIGVSYTEVRYKENLTNNNFGLIIINRVITNNEFGTITNFVKAGGAILDMGYCVDRINDKGSCTEKKCAMIIPQNMPFLFPQCVIDLKTKIKVYSDALFLDGSFSVDKMGKGYVSFLGLPIPSMLQDNRSTRKNFIANSPRFPSEEVATVSKGEITYLFFCVLRYLFIVRGLPFVHKWFFPGHSESVFMYRIDCDDGTRKQIESKLQLAADTNMKFTWFLHLEAHKEFIDIFSEVGEHEISIHGYEHFTSRNYLVIKNDIDKSIKMIKKIGGNCQGYAAPYGLWNVTLDSVCNDVGFRYASEFSFGYDSLPIRPIIKNRISNVLQIPIHPIGIDALLFAKANDQKILNYFKNEIIRKKFLLQPVIFYDHLSHDRSNLLKNLFKMIHDESIPVLTFLEYTSFWEKREKLSFASFIDSNTNELRYKRANKDSACCLCVWESDDRYILTDSETGVNSSTDIERNVSSFNKNNTEMLKIVRKTSFRLKKLSMLNKLLWRNRK